MINWFILAILLTLILSSYFAYINVNFKSKAQKNKVKKSMIIIWIILIVVTTIALFAIN